VPWFPDVTPRSLLPLALKVLSAFVLKVLSAFVLKVLSAFVLVPLVQHAKKNGSRGPSLPKGGPRFA